MGFFGPIGGAMSGLAGSMLPSGGGSQGSPTGRTGMMGAIMNRLPPDHPLAQKWANAMSPNQGQTIGNAPDVQGIGNLSPVRPGFDQNAPRPWDHLGQPQITNDAAPPWATGLQPMQPQSLFSQPQTLNGVMGNIYRRQPHTSSMGGAMRGAGNAMGRTASSFARLF